jgi:ABC-type lipoprotein export system ATPase subunit
MPMVQVSNLKKTYTLGRVNVPVLRGINFSCDDGECVAILGASGSGKSTLLHLIGGLDRPDRDDGRILSDGVELTTLSSGGLNRYRAENVGFVFQFYHLLPELSVLQNVLIAAMVRKGASYPAHSGVLKQRALKILDEMGLSHRLTHRPAELSGGERQRVAIARALINEPRLFLADEPTGNLDQATGAKIMDGIMNIRSRVRQTMILVTHDAQTAARADRIVRIQDGVLVNT